MAVLKLLLQKLWRKDVPRVIAIFPDFVALVGDVLRRLFKECQRPLIVLCLVLTNDLSGGMFLELAHNA